MLPSVVTTIQTVIAFLSLLFAGFLLAGRSRLGANRYLAGFLLLLAVQLAFLVVMQAGGPWILGSLTAALGMAFGPLVYLYARALLRDGGRFRRPWLHFVPACVVLAVGLAGIGSGIHYALLDHASLAIYLALTLIFLWRHRAESADESAARRSSWILEILLVGAAAFVADVVRFWAELGDLGAYREPTRLLLFLVLLVLVTRVVLKGLMQPELFRSAPDDSDGTPAAKYGGSALAPAEAEALAERLTRHLQEERTYLDPSLTLGGLAERLGVAPRTLSQVVNSQLGQSFSELVNGYRVEEAKRLLADPERDREPVLDLALEAGFNSKSSFNEAFKRITGTTPSQYRRRQGS
ncbi:MAG: helix-turn-helix domain-containing protein [Thermoanaerobaculia bacterium]|nr:helix-turn-helix domain-containing protein [Thermoanaerobaculia bacterium]